MFSLKDVTLKIALVFVTLVIGFYPLLSSPLMPFTTQFSSKTLENLNVLKTLGYVNSTTLNSTKNNLNTFKTLTNHKPNVTKSRFYNTNSNQPNRYDLR